jgi:TatD DNase family protein
MIPFINIHTHKPDFEHSSILNITDITNWPKGKQYKSSGIHPWDIAKIDLETQLQNIEDLCKVKKILALGEIGIDRTIQTSYAIQKEVFIKQLTIANQYNLPVIIHCVKAWSDLLSIRKNGKHKTPWIFHGFTGNLQTANQLIKSGVYLSFGLKLLQSQKLQETFKQIPTEFIFFENDDSDTKIEDIYKKAAELYDICIDELKIEIHHNFIKVFGEQWEQNG